MAATRDDITRWFNKGVAEGASHMVIVCDTFDYEDFPVLYKSAEAAREKVENPGSMQRIMEVYYLREPLADQIDKHRCFNFGPENVSGS